MKYCLLLALFLSYSLYSQDTLQTGELIVISDPGLEPVIADFLESKVDLGITASFVGLNYIVEEFPNSENIRHQSIKAFLENQLENSEIKPEYVLLVADYDLLPSPLEEIPENFKQFLNENEEVYLNDNQIGNFDGRQEIWISRIPVTWANDFLRYTSKLDRYNSQEYSLKNIFLTGQLSIQGNENESLNKLVDNYDENYLNTIKIQSNLDTEQDPKIALLAYLNDGIDNMFVVDASNAHILSYSDFNLEFFESVTSSNSYPLFLVNRFQNDYTPLSNNLFFNLFSLNNGPVFISGFSGLSYFTNQSAKFIEKILEYEFENPDSILGDALIFAANSIPDGAYPNSFGDPTIKINISRTASIIANLKGDEFLVYPNPSNGDLSFSKELETFKVYDLSGNILINNSNKDLIRNLTSGAYLIVGKDFEGKMQTAKFVIE